MCLCIIYIQIYLTRYTHVNIHTQLVVENMMFLNECFYSKTIFMSIFTQDFLILEFCTFFVFLCNDIIINIIEKFVITMKIPFVLYMHECLLLYSLLRFV